MTRMTERDKMSKSKLIESVVANLEEFMVRYQDDLDENVGLYLRLSNMVVFLKYNPLYDMKDIQEMVTRRHTVDITFHFDNQNNADRDRKLDMIKRQIMDLYRDIIEHMATNQIIDILSDIDDDLIRESVICQVKHHE